VGARILAPRSMVAALAVMTLGACAAGPAIKSRPLTPGIFLDAVRPADTAGAATRSVSSDGLALTKVSEGFRAQLYLDAASYCSIAYGHLVAKRPCDGNEPPDFSRGLSLQEGNALLVTDMGRAQRAMSMNLPRDAAALSDDQYASLCDFVYNVGGDHFRSSTLRQVIIEHRYAEVPRQMRRWILAGGKRVEGLATRREREIALFFKGQTIPQGRPSDASLGQIDVTLGETSQGDVVGEH
jgi:lysozyme